MRRLVRALSLLIVVFAWPVLAVGFIQANVASWASANHYDTFIISGLSWVGSHMPDFTNLAASYWFWLAAGLAAGFAIGVWIDAILKKGSNLQATPKNEVNEKCHLRLVFDNELLSAGAIEQVGINFYYWYHFPSVAIDYESRQLSSRVGYVVVFLALKEPSYTNNSRITVVGGGINCELVSHHPSAAVVRIMGDMRGRTVDIQLGKDPIPIA